MLCSRLVTANWSPAPDTSVEGVHFPPRLVAASRGGMARFRVGLCRSRRGGRHCGCSPGAASAWSLRRPAMKKREGRRRRGGRCGGRRMRGWRRSVSAGRCGSRGKLIPVGGRGAPRVTRAGARPANGLWVTGALGEEHRLHLERRWKRGKRARRMRGPVCASTPTHRCRTPGSRWRARRQYWSVSDGLGGDARRPRGDMRGRGQPRGGRRAGRLLLFGGTHPLRDFPLGDLRRRVIGISSCSPRFPSEYGAEEAMAFGTASCGRRARCVSAPLRTESGIRATSTGRALALGRGVRSFP